MEQSEKPDKETKRPNFEDQLKDLPSFSEAIREIGPTKQSQAPSKMPFDPSLIYGLKARHWRQRLGETAAQVLRKRFILKSVVIALLALTTFGLLWHQLAPPIIALPEGRYLGLTSQGQEWLYIADPQRRLVYPISLKNLQIGQPFALPNASICGLTKTENSFWSADAENQTIYEHEPGSYRMIKSFPVPSVGPLLLHWQKPDLWIGDPKGKLLYRTQIVDSSIEIIAGYKIELGQMAALTTDESRLWLLDAADKKINRYRLEKGKLSLEESLTLQKLLPQGSIPAGLTANGPYLWLSADNPPAIYRLRAF